MTWTHRVDRDALTVETKNTLGSTLTLFRPGDDAAGELRQRRVPLDAPAQLPSKPAEATGDAAALDQIGEAMEQKSRDFIEDRIARLGPYEMQDLVAGILRAMGYKARVSPPGPDGGHDIFASPDGLGLEEPRIFVEVKHRTGTQIGAPDVRSFLGGRRPGDRCLYVSSGGFTKDAKSEAQRAAVPLTLVDLGQLRELLVDYYDKLDPEAQQLVPLKRLYWPIEPTE
jgi:restriction system protein